MAVVSVIKSMLAVAAVGTYLVMNSCGWWQWSSPSVVCSDGSSHWQWDLQVMAATMFIIIVGVGAIKLVVEAVIWDGTYRR